VAPRKYGHNTVCSFAREFTLAAISTGGDIAHDLVERAWEGDRMLASVSTPIAWSEVTRTLDPTQFIMRTPRARLDKHGDLATPLVDERGALATSLAQLAPRE
jgi:hypothetical protein